MLLFIRVPSIFTSDGLRRGGGGCLHRRGGRRLGGLPLGQDGPEALGEDVDRAGQVAPSNLQCQYRAHYKVATDTNILDLRTRYRTKLGRFFWF